MLGYGYSPGVLSGGGSSDTPSSTSGVFDFLERGTALLERGYTSYLNLTGKNPMTPERQTEYDYVPRDIAGPVVNAGGIGLSWPMIALAALAFIALTASSKG